MLEKDLVPMGYISGAFGVHGWIKIHTDTEQMDSLFDYPTWWIGKPNGTWRSYTFCDGGVQSKAVVACLDGIEDRDSAIALRGFTIAVLRSELPVLPDDEYYWSDLIGLRVIGNDNCDLGCITEMMESGANDVMVIKNGGEQRLIPFVEPIVIEVDMTARCVKVDWSHDYLLD